MFKDGLSYCWCVCSELDMKIEYGWWGIDQTLPCFLDRARIVPRATDKSAAANTLCSEGRRNVIV